MKEANLYKTYILHQLFDKLDILEWFEDKNRKVRIGEFLIKQAEIYETPGVALQTSHVNLRI